MIVFAGFQITLTPIYMILPDGYKEDEAQEPSGREKVDALCEMAVIFGMPVEEAEQATPDELEAYLAPYTKQDAPPVKYATRTT